VAPAQEPGSVILEGAIHLGNDATPEWPEADADPRAGKAYTIQFQSKANDKERAIEVMQRHVDNDWTLSLNGERLAKLRRGVGRQIRIYPVPAGALKNGENKLRVSIGNIGDDITFGPIRLLDRSYRDILQVRPVTLQVYDLDTQDPLPARLTVVDQDGSFRQLHYPEQSTTPIRDGVAYTDAKGRAVLELGAGTTTIYATHGAEWSVAEVVCDPAADQSTALRLGIREEVDTRGWLSADTHIHTYTYSGHGDATLEERVLSLAAEGLDIAIATDHNHHTDYGPAQEAAGLATSYRSIVGNEVTTDLGHLNAFPFDSDARIPDHKLQEWPALVAEIRAKGAQVVILNHPRWPDREEGPFGVSALDPRTGRFADGLRLTVDAMEVFNSTTPETPWSEVMQDWFSLLNAGSSIRGVGSSDSHSVLDPVGQGRTWLRSSTDDPNTADIDEICTAFRRGHSSMGIGLFGKLKVQGVDPGEVATPEGEALQVDFHIAGASWARAESAVVYLNGIPVAEITMPAQAQAKPLVQDLRFLIPAPTHDAWLVCVARGPRPDGPWWYSLFDDLALVTNPVWIDADGDGVYRSPAEIAERACDKVRLDAQGMPILADLAGRLSDCDEAVAVQVLVEAMDRWGASFPDRIAQIPTLCPRHRTALSELIPAER
jgi:hypothetical protein